MLTRVSTVQKCVLDCLGAFSLHEFLLNGFFRVVVVLSRVTCELLRFLQHESLLR